MKKAVPRRRTGLSARDASSGLDRAVGALARTPVYRLLPARVRTCVDRAILRRPKGLNTLVAISDRFELRGLGISPAALRHYARRLESLARPAVAGQVLATVFGRLRPDDQARLFAGTQVLLLSKVVQALTSENASLSVAELTRLGTALAALQRPHRPIPADCHPKSRRTAASGQAVAAGSPQSIADLVRGVYGLDLKAKENGAD